jgi:hypothetical protein
MVSASSLERSPGWAGASGVRVIVQPDQAASAWSSFPIGEMIGLG